MKKGDKTRRAAEAPRERISRLSAAILRISASLDVGTVLREVVDSARVLTGARYGVIATIDEAGRPQGHVASGLSPEEERQMAGWPDAVRLFEHLRGLDGPLRLADLGDYVRSLGLAPGLVPCRTFQGTPMRHHGLDVGNFFLGEKEGGEEFTDEDEEVLVLFAAQAATAIANARMHRDERRARAGLEALVETSPVGVVVFDARTAMPVSYNREARRIVEELRVPGRSAMELLEVLNARLADGREVTLDQLKTAETLRATEVELSVPDGRSTRMLINVTPIPSAEGDIESVVVTMQDLAPLEELERLRAEFLGMVSHELRAPLTSIKGSTTTLLASSRALDRAEMRQFIRIIDQQADHMQGLIGDLLDAGRIDSGTLSVDPEPCKVGTLVDQARTTFLSGGGRQTVRIDLEPDLPRVMADERRIVQVLGNLLVERGPELAGVVVACEVSSGARRDLHVAVAVADEGTGSYARDESASPVPQVLPARSASRDLGQRGHGIRPGPGHLQGVSWRPTAGRIWAESDGPGLGARCHLHPAGGGGGRFNRALQSAVRSSDP